jgi:DNA-binding NtrC family response regulator
MASRIPENGTAARRVLIIDGDVAQATTIARGLAADGYEPALASSVSSARALLAREPFAALVTDLVLPDGGRRWLAEVRAMLPRLAVMVMGSDSVEALGLDRVYGLADAVVSTPAHPAVLSAMLERAMASRGVS